MTLVFDIVTVLGVAVALPVFVIYLGWHYESRRNKEPLFWLKNPELIDYVAFGIAGVFIAFLLPVVIIISIVLAILFGVAKLAQVVTKLITSNERENK